MLAWWSRIGIERVDLAVRQTSGAMLWHCDLGTTSLPLAWARAQNVRQGDVYIRPARAYPWPLVFLDDVEKPRAQAVARKYDALIVETSAAGGCHVWLACEHELAESSRCQAQRWLAQRIHADLGSISGEHLGRLAGFKNWKRRGTWVNVLAASRHGRRWDPSTVPSLTESPPQPRRAQRREATDTTPSGKEWGWVCGQLETGSSPYLVYARLLKQARTRRGADAPRYARRTLQRALQRTGHPAARRGWQEIPRPNPKEVARV
jgi:hypothetical protein